MVTVKCELIISVDREMSGGVVDSLHPVVTPLTQTDTQTHTDTDTETDRR